VARGMYVIYQWHCKGKGKGKVILVLTSKHHTMKVYWGSGCIAPLIFDLGTKRR
jgi:hypothetical protein